MGPRPKQTPRRLALGLAAAAAIAAGAPSAHARTSKRPPAQLADATLFRTMLVRLRRVPRRVEAAESMLGAGWQKLAAWALAERERTLGLVVAVGDGLDRILAAVDPRGLLPRLELAAYRVLTCVPVEGEQSSHFGWRFHPILRRKKLHKGIDFSADRGTIVRAAAPGMVVHAGPKGSYGRLVVIDHGLGVETRYAHLDRVNAHVGEYVSATAVIGRVGASGRATGPHLHFEVRYLGEAINPRVAFVEVPSWPIAK